MPKKVEEKQYCGVGPIKKGFVRGTPEYCLANKQVRYYGVEELSQELADQIGTKILNLFKEEQKLAKLHFDGKKIKKDFTEIERLLGFDNIKPGKKKLLEKKKAAIIKKAKKLAAKIKAQANLVEDLQKKEKKKKKKKKKKK